MLGDGESEIPELETPWISDAGSVKGSEGPNSEESDDSSAGVDWSLVKNDPAPTRILEINHGVIIYMNMYT